MITLSDTKQSSEKKQEFITSEKQNQKLQEFFKILSRDLQKLSIFQLKKIFPHYNFSIWNNHFKKNPHKRNKQFHQNETKDHQRWMLLQRIGKHDLLSEKLHQCHKRTGRKILTNLQWNRWKRNRNHQKTLRNNQKPTKMKRFHRKRWNTRLWGEHLSKGHKNHWKRLLSLRYERKRKSDSRMNDQK